MTTGERIKYLRIQKGMSQEELGAKLGVQKSAIHKYESGLVVNLKRSTIARLAEALDTTPAYLMGYDEPASPKLSQKDERDIARDLTAFMEELEQGGDLMFDGNPMTPEARESILAAMRLGLEAAKAKNKERFTPKKYRKD